MPALRLPWFFSSRFLSGRACGCQLLSSWCSFCAVPLLSGCAGAIDGPLAVVAGGDGARQRRAGCLFRPLALGDPRTGEQLWSQVDEQTLSNQLRWQLSRNGFRLGLTGPGLPDPLVQLMELQDHAPPPGNDLEHHAKPVGEEEKVTRRHLQLRPGQRSEVVVSEVYDEWPVLTCRPGQVSGQSYRQARGSFGLKVAPQHDGRVRLELTPELSYGEVRGDWVGEQGVLRLDVGQPRRVFDDMTISTTLAPGQMLLMTCLADRPGSIGHYFFTASHSGSVAAKSCCWCTCSRRSTTTWWPPPRRGR